MHGKADKNFFDKIKTFFTLDQPNYPLGIREKFFNTIILYYHA
jgi:hypothetical protein